MSLIYVKERDGYFHFKAFTLSEILIVLAIIGSITIVSIPGFVTISNYFRFNGTVNELANDIRLAHQLTITELANYTIQLYPYGVFPPAGEVENSYKLFKLVNGVEIVKKRVRLLNRAYITLTDLPENRVSFNFNGSASASGRIRVNKIPNDNTSIKVITINAPTGKVSIYDYWPNSF